MFGKNIAIDLGTATIIIFVEGRGIVLSEPSIVAYFTKTKEFITAGYDAFKMLGRTPDSITVAHPLSKGVISDYVLTEKMLRYFLNKACRHRLSNPKMIVCMPSIVTTVERRSIVEVCSNCGARKVSLIEEPLAAAIGAGVDISRPYGTLVVDIGGGTTDVAVITMGSIAAGRSIKIAGNSFDEAITKYVRKKFFVLIGSITAERIKKEIGCAFPRKEIETMKAKGRNYITGMPAEFEIDSKQVFEALQDPLLAITNGIQEILENTPPELVTDISKEGIIMTGGGSLLRDLDRLIEWKTRVPTRVAPDAVNCVVLGTGKCLKHINELPDGSEYTGYFATITNFGGLS